MAFIDNGISSSRRQRADDQRHVEVILEIPGNLLVVVTWRLPHESELNATPTKEPLTRWLLPTQRVNSDRNAGRRAGGVTHGIATRRLILSFGRAKRYWCGRRPEIGVIITRVVSTRSSMIRLRTAAATNPSVPFFCGLIF